MTLEPEVQVVFKYENESSEASPPCVSWGYGTTPDKKMTVTSDPLLAFSWGPAIYIIRIKEPSEDKIYYAGMLKVDCDINNLCWLGESLLFSFDSKRQIRLFCTTYFQKGTPPKKGQVEPDFQIQLNQKEKTSVPLLDSQSTDPEITFQTNIHDHNGRQRYNYRNTVIAVLEKQYVLFLGQKRLSRAKLASWDECLDKLVEQNEWLEALANGLDIFLGKSKGLANLPKDEQGRIQYVKPKLINIVAGYIQLKNIEVDAMISTAIEFCIGIQAYELLFGEIQSQFFKRNQQKEFIENLEPFVLSHKLDQIPAATLSILSNHYLEMQKPQILGNIIVHLDPNLLTPDTLEILIQTCDEHDLLSSFIYICTQTSIKDFISPLAKIYECIENKTDMVAKLQLCHKLLWYFQMCLNGKLFPNGIIETHEQVVKDIIAWLFDEQQQPLEGLCKLDMQRMLKLLLPLFEPGKLCNYILKFEEEREGKEPEEGEVVCPSHKKMIEQLASLVLNKQYKALFKPHFTFFIAQIIQMEYIVIPSPIIFVTAKFFLDHTIYRPPPQPQALQQLKKIVNYQALANIQGGPNVLNPDFTFEEKDKMLLSLLEYLNEDGLDEKKLKQLHTLIVETPYVESKVFILELRQEYQQCFKIFIQNENNDSRKFVFQWLDKILEKLKNTQEHDKLKSQILGNLNILVQVDGNETASLVTKWFDQHHNQIIQKLEGAPELQLSYLKTIIGTTEEDKKIFDQYFKLLCKHKPEQVKPFLLSREEYPLDDCLKYCQENEVHDATAFLMERMGDTLGAQNIVLNQVLKPLLKDLEKKTKAMQQVDAKQMTEIETKFVEALQICTRNSGKIDKMESERLWLTFIDVVFQTYMVIPKQSQKQVETLMQNMIRQTLDGVMEELDFGKVMQHINKNYQSVTFQNFKDSLVNLLYRHSYQSNMLKRAAELVNSDIYYHVSQLMDLQKRGMTSQEFACNKCNEFVCSDRQVRENSKILMFTCGHLYHVNCLNEDQKCQLCEQEQMAKGLFLLAQKKNRDK